MKKSNKKGFTIVELVIVIAVIAILAAVLIPTFTNVIDKANESKDMQAARIAYENYLADYADKAGIERNICIKSGSHYYLVTKGQFISNAVECNNTSNYKAAVVDGENFKYIMENGKIKLDATTKLPTFDTAEHTHNS